METVDTNEPILKHGDIVNGIIPIEIVNINQLCPINDAERATTHYEFGLSFKFKLMNEANAMYHSDYLNEFNTWQITEFAEDFIDEKNKLSIKVPLFLVPYTIEYTLTIKKRKVIDENINNGRYRYQEDNLKLISTFTSTLYSTIIPSMLMESIYKKGDPIQYTSPDTGYLKDGIILELLESNMIKIRTNTEDLDEGEDDIMAIDASKLHPPSIEDEFLIDITNYKYEGDLILKTKDTDKIDLYTVLSECLFEFYWYEMNEIEDEKHLFQHLSCLIAINIYKYLFLAEYNLRIQCLFCDTYLFEEEQWKYHIGRSIRCADNEIFRNHYTYTCDLCRINVNWYQFMYHCGQGVKAHDLCLCCVYSVMIQYKQMKPFIYELLKSKMDINCIEEIVTFCVGKVNKFDIDDNEKQYDEHVDMIMMDGNTRNDLDITLFDDTEHVGCKRALKINHYDSGAKRIRQ